MSSPADYHLHTRVSHDAQGSVADYIRRAEEIGIEEICFTEHLDFYPSPDGLSGTTIPTEQEIQEYLRDVRDAAQRTRVRVRAGLEVDYKPEADRWIHDLVPRLDLDFALGSVHNVGPWGISGPADLAEGYFAERGVEGGCLDYLAVVEQAVATGLFDSLAHIDVVKRFKPKNSGLLLGGKPRDAVVAILDDMAARNMAIEVNSAGLFHLPKEPYPGPELLRLARDRGIRAVTLGSDAHHPEDLGRCIQAVAALAHTAGFTRLRTFEARNPIPHSL